MIQTLAQLTGHKLVDFPMNSDTDTTELVGSFQQVSNIGFALLILQLLCIRLT